MQLSFHIDIILLYSVCPSKQIENTALPRCKLIISFKITVSQVNRFKYFHGEPQQTSILPTEAAHENAQRHPDNFFVIR
jgi:hypothetical protein